MEQYDIKYHQRIPSKQQNQIEWLELCEYVSVELLKYGEEKKFPQQLALRLKGIAANKYIPTKNMKQCYSYKFVKWVIVIIKPQILNAISRTQIQDEKHLINLICKIINDNWNDVCDILQRKLNQRKMLGNQLDNADLQKSTELGCNYQIRQKNTKNIKKLFN